MTSRIKGPGDGPPKVGEVDSTDGVDEIAPSQSEPVGAPTATNAAPLTDPVAKITERLRAGEISVDQAVDLLIDDAVERQVGAAGREVASKLRQVLRSHASSDPTLSARIRRLTQLK